MRPLRVCIYGGTDLQGTPTDFIAALAGEILERMSAVIVTGGFAHSNARPDAISTDVAALRGARDYALRHGIALKDCYEAWIPDPKLDKRPDVRGAVRMTEADGITIRVLTRTPLGRRLAMVAGVDIVVTIAGQRHTEVVVEQALDLGVPVLSIPDAGGDSEKLLNEYRTRIAAMFDPGALDTCLQRVSADIAARPSAAAATVVDLLRTARIGRCLVLLPYDAEHDALYRDTLQPAVSKHMIPLRLDRLPSSEAIATGLGEAIRSSAAVVADVTVLNENVMYEVGYAHGRGLTPLLYTRTRARLEELPVYFRSLNVRLAPTSRDVAALIDEYLSAVKDARRSFHAAP